jgi:hypothetical protein
MDIDFNNVRVQAIQAYNRLVITLNKNIESTIGGWKKIEVPVDDIQQELDELRSTIGAIACTYKKDDPDFKCIFNDKTHMECFNEEE